MKKLFLVLSLGFVVDTFALSGYLGTAYTSVLKDGYNECVHTSYFDKDHDGVAQCGEAATPQKVSNQSSTKSGN